MSEKIPNLLYQIIIICRKDNKAKKSERETPWSQKKKKREQTNLDAKKIKCILEILELL
jgi:hypothetical protein